MARTIEYLAQLYPEKTGKELFEIQAKDKDKDQKEFETRNKKKLAIIKDFEENGAYYRGSSGLNQYYYIEMTKIQLENNVLYCNYNNIVVFDNFTKPFSCEINEERFVEYGNLGLSMCERVTKEDYEKVRQYFTSSIDIFWKRIDPNS